MTNWKMCEYIILIPQFQKHNIHTSLNMTMRYCCESCVAGNHIHKNGLLEAGRRGLICGRYEADHLPTSAEVKKTWIYLYMYTAPYAFMA
jgi:hypothetical protein